MHIRWIIDICNLIYDNLEQGSQNYLESIISQYIQSLNIKVILHYLNFVGFVLAIAAFCNKLLFNDYLILA